MKLALLPNLTREKSILLTKQIIDELNKLKVDYKLKDSDRKSFPEFKPELFLREDKLLGWCDVVVSVGGDGSLLYSGKKAVKHGKPILGINAGRLAFLAGLENNELNLLSKLILGNYKVDRRMILSTMLYREDRVQMEDFCINDIVLARGATLKMTDIDVDVNNKHYYTYRGDGIIVATPTGSTSYSLSAGGPVLDPIIESILVTPICTQSLFARSVIFSPESTITIAPNSDTMNSDLYLSLDGEQTVNIALGDKIAIRKSEKYLDIIRIKPDEFFDVLHNKLVYRRV